MGFGTVRYGTSMVAVARYVVLKLDGDVVDEREGGKGVSDKLVSMVEGCWLL